MPQSRVTFLEHVQARITLMAPKRGDIQIFLISPAGTRSQLLHNRERDNSRSGFREWSFMSTHMWGEQASGVWYLQIDNDGWKEAELLDFDLILYGTAEPVGEVGGLDTYESQRILERIGLPRVSGGSGSRILTSHTLHVLLLCAILVNFLINNS
jgi:furin